MAARGRMVDAPLRVCGIAEQRCGLTILLSQVDQHRKQESSLKEETKFQVCSANPRAHPKTGAVIDFSRDLWTKPTENYNLKNQSVME